MGLSWKFKEFCRILEFFRSFSLFAKRKINNINGGEESIENRSNINEEIPRKRRSTTIGRGNHALDFANWSRRYIHSLRLIKFTVEKTEDLIHVRYISQIRLSVYRKKSLIIFKGTDKNTQKKLYKNKSRKFRLHIQESYIFRRSPRSTA